MTRFDKVARLQELEKKATPGPWKWEDWEETTNEAGPGDYWLVAPPETRPTGLVHCCPDLGNNILADEERESSEEDRQLIANMRNAATWLMEAAACFQPGDAERIARIVRDDLLEGCCGQCNADVDMMHRLQKAAEIMEELEYYRSHVGEVFECRITE